MGNYRKTHEFRTSIVSKYSTHYRRLDHAGAQNNYKRVRNKCHLARGGTETQLMPHADPGVLEFINKDVTRLVRIDRADDPIYHPVPLRYYGDVGIAFMAWDDPREVHFQNGSRQLMINNEKLILVLNAPYKVFMINGKIHQIKLGGPTRELFIDGHFFEVPFGDSPKQIMVNGCLFTVSLSGPTPKLKIGCISRTDLVAGVISLIVDVRNVFPIFLDAKPQRFEVASIPYIIRFVEALQTVVINGVPFKFDYGGKPLAIYLNGGMHFLRLSVLPPGIKPGYVSIVNMDGGNLLTPPPWIGEYNMMTPVESGNSLKQIESCNRTNERFLGSISGPTKNESYVVQSNKVEHTLPVSPAPTPSSYINVADLYQRLVACGIVPASGKIDSKKAEENDFVVKPVDFSKPETFKVRQPGLIARIYSGIQCDRCGERFPQQEYNKHLDWHFWQNSNDKETYKTLCRSWNYSASDWVKNKGNDKD